MSGPSPKSSTNFGFLAKHDRHLARLAGFAELYCSSDPNTSLVKQRQVVERLAQLAAARFGVEGAPNLRGLISELYDELADRGLRFRPHCWLSDEWFTPDGVPGIANT